MKALRIALPLLVAFATPLVAQDTTQAAPAPAASAVTVEVVLARSVMDRAPVDSGSAFPADVGQLVLWTKVNGAIGSSIRHVWFHGDTEVGNVELPVSASPYRTWSRKTVPLDWTGAWHIEVRDASGAVLRRVDFTVGQ